MNKDLSIMANLIEDWAQKDPDLDVLTFVSVGADGELAEQTRSYRQLWENGQKLAALIRSQGLGEGDPFAIVMPNHPEFVDLMVASSILGTVFVPIDPRTQGDRLRYMLDFAECKAAFVSPDALSSVQAVWGDSGNWICALEGQESSVEAALSEPVPEPLLPVVSSDPNAPMQLLYTSGTTGDPKAILSPHSRFMVGRGVGQLLGITREDRPYTGLSLTHANAQLITLSCGLVYGNRTVISRQFTKSRLWEITRQYGCTWFNLLGGMTNAIYAMPEQADDADNPVRIVLSAGMPAAIWDKFKARFQVELTEIYGAAEGGLTFNLFGAGPSGSCGKAPADLELSVRDDDDQPCAPGQLGEICFKNVDGSSPVVRYFKNPEASEKKTQNGWLRMGDVGYLDEEGWLFFHHRKGGGLRRNGDFIDTTHIEKVLSESAQVDDVYVYGVPAANGTPGEKDIVAAMVSAASDQSDQAIAASLFAICQQQLTANYVPSYMQIISEIPKTASEKPIERYLLEAFNKYPEQVISQSA